MFNGFNREATEFLAGIRANNNKQWFEEHKEIYKSEVYEPLCELAKELLIPYSEIDDMMVKAGRIYKDPFLSPEIRYRDTMWIYLRHEAYWWNKTPTFFFELSPEGAVYGFRISKPDASVLELLRQRLDNEQDEFFELMRSIEQDSGLEVLYETFKRPKAGAKPFNEKYYNIRSLSIHTRLTDGRTLYSRKLKDKVLDVYSRLFGIEEYFQSLIIEDGINKAKKEISHNDPMERAMPTAPKVDFMW